MYLAYEYVDPSDVHSVVFRKSTDDGVSWGGNPSTLDNHRFEPCIAAIGQYVLVSLARQSGTALEYQYSTNGGAVWHPKTSKVFQVHTGWSYDRANVTSVLCPYNGVDYPGFLIVARVKMVVGSRTQWTTRGEFLHIAPPYNYVYVEPMHMSAGITYGADEPLNPSIAALYWSGPERPIGCCVTSGVNSSHDGRCILESHGAWYPEVPYPEPPMNTARLLAQDADHTLHYASAQSPFFEAGPVIGDCPVYATTGPGGAPALALDGGGQCWVAFLNSDSVWCACDTAQPKLVFAGSSSAVPGQPSIVCYPNQASGVYVGAIAFPVYDTVNGTSAVLFAKVDTGHLVLDTIDLCASLADSLPCINIANSDSLFVTFQSGTFEWPVVQCRTLYNYGASDWSQPATAWGFDYSYTGGRHPASRIENDILHCEWKRTMGSGQTTMEAVEHQARYVGNNTTMFAGWLASGNPMQPGPDTVDNVSYCGQGATVWQEKVSGKSRIRGSRVGGVEPEYRRYQAAPALHGRGHVRGGLGRVRHRRMSLLHP